MESKYSKSSPKSIGDQGQNYMGTRDVLDEPKMWLPGQPLNLPIPQKGDYTENWLKTVSKYDTDLCQGWKGEIDNLLIFAGLFSAIVTAFAVESFSWLGDPTETDTTSKDPVANYLIRINIFWYLSLVISLAAVSLGILCSQWLREFQRDVSRYSLHGAIGIRQLRFEGLVKWKVPEIVNILPFLLQIAMVFFFIGLCDLLFQLNSVVGVTILVPVALTIGFLAVTAMAPAFSWIFFARTLNREGVQVPSAQCPYKSPQAWIFQRFCLFVYSGIRLIFYYCKRVSGSPTGRPRDFKTLSYSSWTQIDYSIYQFWGRRGSDYYLARAWLWSYDNFGQSRDVLYDLLHCFSSFGIDTKLPVLFPIGSSSVQKPVIGLGDHRKAQIVSLKVSDLDFLRQLPLTSWPPPHQTHHIVGHTATPMVQESQHDLFQLWLICQRRLPSNDLNIQRAAIELHIRLQNYAPTLVEQFVLSDGYYRSHETDTGIAHKVDVQRILTADHFMSCPDEPLSPFQIPIPTVQHPIDSGLTTAYLRKMCDWSLHPGQHNHLSSLERLSAAALCLVSLDRKSQVAYGNDFLKMVGEVLEKYEKFQSDDGYDPSLTLEMHNMIRTLPFEYSHKSEQKQLGDSLEVAEGSNIPGRS